MLNLKKGILSLMTLSLISLAQARALDTPQAARRVQKKLGPSVLKNLEVNSIGVDRCNPNSGEPAYKDEDYIYCVKIYTSNKDAYRAMMKRFPEGTRVDGVFVIIEDVGAPGINPKISIGN